MHPITFELPEFCYLNKAYLGDFYHIQNNSFFRINIEPNKNFDSIEKITSSYETINNLVYCRDLKLTYCKEIADVVVNTDTDSYVIKLPVQILSIYDCKNNRVSTLRPNIDTVTITKCGSLFIYTINIDFNLFFSKIDELRDNLINLKSRY
ncbi:hypothetical protein QKC54_gp0132 [Megavirus baoshan]|uniref:Uncharacterized protein n=1 Tax=Megavirus baoshan TaxID=2496520 RepID=A0A3Q8U8I6_9VIRU|nr:hypothetical protein QKC54_gp0132 [Megavirus baoshan]AZL89783.1 hypothetical protein Mb0940 [Megavirus baoshan]